jgi:hypothetical protein
MKRASCGTSPEQGGLQRSKSLRGFEDRVGCLQLMRFGVVGQFAVAALSERRNSLRTQDRRSETAATKTKLTHYLTLRSLEALPPA